MKNFKHLIIVALAAVLVCGSADAKLRFGVKVGTNVNKIHFDKETVKQNFDADNQCGFTAGVTTEYIAPALGIGFDLSLMYAYMKNEIKSKDAEGVIGKNFIEIPLNLKYSLSLPALNNLLKPMVYTGPVMSLKLDKSTFEDIKSRTVQLGWNVGVGLELFKHLQISGGYTFGINNVVKYIPTIKDQVELVDLKAKNNYWTVTAAYMF